MIQQQLSNMKSKKTDAKPKIENKSMKNDKSKSKSKSQKEAKKVRDGSAKLKPEAQKNSKANASQKGAQKSKNSKSLDLKKGGYNKFVEEFLKTLKDGSDRKAALQKAAEAWQKLSDKKKLEQYGVKPDAKSKTQVENPKGNFNTFKKHFVEKEKAQKGKHFNSQEAGESAKQAWSKMSEKEKLKFALPSKSGDQKDKSKKGNTTKSQGRDKSKSADVSTKRGKSQKGSKSPADKNQKGQKSVVQKNSKSQKGSRSPANQKSKSVKGSKSPANQNAKSQKGSKSPANKKAKSQKGSKSPANKMAKSQKGSKSPIDKKGKSQKGSKSPVDKKGKSQKGSKSPVDKKAKSQKGSKSPNDKKGKTLKAEKSTNGKKAKSQNGSKSPSTKQGKSQKGSTSRKADDSKKGKDVSMKSSQKSNSKSQQKSVSGNKNKSSQKSSKEEDFRKAFEKHQSKPAFDIPVKYFISNKKKGETTVNKLLKDLKCALVVNVASKCGHTSKHYQQLVELKQKFGGHGFEIFAFPCNQFGGQEPKDSETVCKWAFDNYKAEFPIFEKVQVNGGSAHPIFGHLKQLAKQDSIPWNFDKFLISSDGKLVKYATAKQAKPIDFQEEIQRLLE